MSEKEIKEILKKSADEIFEYILKHPDSEDDIINHLKIGSARTKFFKVAADLKSMKLNKKGTGATKRDVVESLSKDAVVTLKVSQISANPGQPRKVFDEERLKELSESIKTFGLLQPIVVRDMGDNKYVLIAGERRLRAHKLANIDEVRAIIADADEIKSRSLAIIENLHRHDLQPLEEGLSYLSLQEENGYSYRDLEDVVKKNKNYIAARINLTKFSDDCIDFILNHNLSNISKLTKILKLEETLHKTLLEKLSKNELSDEDIEKFNVDEIKKLPDQKLSQTPNVKAKAVPGVDKDSSLEEDFSKEKKEAQVEALTQKVQSQELDNDSNESSEDYIEPTSLKETKALKIIGNKTKRINITLDVENMTGNDLKALQEFISSL